MEAVKGMPYRLQSCAPLSNSSTLHHSNHACGEPGQYTSLRSASSLVAYNGETPWSTGWCHCFSPKFSRLSRLTQLFHHDEIALFRRLSWPSRLNAGPQRWPLYTRTLYNWRKSKRLTDSADLFCAPVLSSGYFTPLPPPPWQLWQRQSP